jgi:hypothetical protein
MTPHNRNKGRLTFPARADHVLQRIKIITRELENIQAEIYGRVSEGDPAESPGLVDETASTQVLGQFRATLDQVRNMLWLCTEAAGEGATKTRGVQRDRQLAQATVLLRALARSGAGTSSSAPASSSSSSSSSMRESSGPGPVSFFDRLDRVIDNYVEGGGTLVEPKPRRRPKT